MKILYRIYEFFFSRWKIEILEEGEEQWKQGMTHIPFGRCFVKYKYTNKFDGSEKIVKKYLN